MITDEVVDQHLDAVLRAAGSARRYYTMEKSIADMRAAMRAAMKVGAEFFSPVPQAPSVPDGWKLVPVEPTTEMCLMAGQRACCPSVDALIIYQAMLAAAPQPECSAYRSQALDDVLAERRRQIEVKGWTPEHDDEHKEGEMAVAAGYYALQCGYPHERERSVPTYWPWDAKWWKPRDKRRNMIKSVALGLAEIERMDRAERSAGDERGAS